VPASLPLISARLAEHFPQVSSWSKEMYPHFGQRITMVPHKIQMLPRSGNLPGVPVSIRKKQQFFQKT
jgi:hypothetical protein